jgi:dipeptidyl aminopeptidase/acylaminoacyl peptidase
MTLYRIAIRFITFSGTIVLCSCAHSQTKTDTLANESRVLSPAQFENLMTTPPCLESYRPHLFGALGYIDSTGNETRDSTFRVETIKIPSEGLMINEWLYLPSQEGKYPLVVLTNGAGDDSRPIKSLSDFIAPVFAHCGIAAFVHDKRGTGLSEGVFAETTYDDYVTDAGNCAMALSKHKEIDSGMIGVMGGSEGGRIAVLAANRYPVFKFVISSMPGLW